LTLFANILEANGVGKESWSTILIGCLNEGNSDWWRQNAFEKPWPAALTLFREHFFDANFKQSQFDKLLVIKQEPNEDMLDYNDRFARLIHMAEENGSSTFVLNQYLKGIKEKELRNRITMMIDTAEVVGLMGKLQLNDYFKLGLKAESQWKRFSMAGNSDEKRVKGGKEDKGKGEEKGQKGNSDKTHDKNKDSDCEEPVLELFTGSSGARYE
jgi:hypothetical protein